MTEPRSGDNSAAALQVFDRSLVRQRRGRSDLANYGFLHKHIANEISDRLQAIERVFDNALVLGGRDGNFAQTVTGQSIGHVITTDLAPVAGHRISFVSDEEWLPIAPESFGLVVAGVTLHAVNDLPGALVQVRRALRPDGFFIGTLFGPGTLTELRTALGEAEIETTGGLSPRIAPFTEVRDGGTLLQRAGFALPVTDTDTLTVRYSNFFDLLRDLRGMGEANTLHERRRVPLRRDTLARTAEIYADRFADEDGKLRASFELIYLAGWAPHESQQQPLRPGSARVSLADALRTEELSAGEGTKNEKS